MPTPHCRATIIARQLAPAPAASTATPRLLEGLRVLELATVVAAPSAGAILCDLGASVIKVEHPKAPDYVRAWRKRDEPSQTADPEHFGQGVGSGFTQFNRGKRGITLDYSKPEGLAILKELLGLSDVFITNVRLKALHKYGLDYQSLCGEFPRLIYAHLSAWGQHGPRRDDPGYDVGAFYAYSGLMELCRSSDEAPLPRYPAAFGDALTGTQLVAGIALALLHRKQTNCGQLVDVSLLRAGVWSMSHPIVAHAAGNGFAAGPKPHIRGSTVIGERASFVTDGAFKCKDGRWVLLLGIESKRHWTKTIRVLGLEQLPDKWPGPRGLDWVAATAMADQVFAQKTYGEWHQLFEAADIWHTPILSLIHI
eukprot:TRINITY_DN32907_c0_g1_i1.p1 TRINITY_DN32907_c0_g1~~TRINITY_DN32907_c0_g1_i1.p1  ORF type:complete len:367 (-),score=93.97 TRINITY_DN32907_c0_g1_i1:96-1196(-)